MWPRLIIIIMIIGEANVQIPVCKRLHHLNLQHGLGIYNIIYGLGSYPHYGLRGVGLVCAMVYHIKHLAPAE